MYKDPDLYNRARAIDCCPTEPTRLFTQRRFGAMIRDAELYGVMPDMVTSKTAYDDDDSSFDVDPLADPTLDRIDIMRSSLAERSRLMNSSSTPGEVSSGDASPVDASPGDVTSVDALPGEAVPTE